MRGLEKRISVSVVDLKKVRGQYNLHEGIIYQVDRFGEKEGEKQVSLAG